MPYYKAVRPDGTDFATGTTRPVIGEWMPRIKGHLKLCKRGYHVSDVPAETLIGGSWPCRLFEVEIAEDVSPEHIDGHKRVVHTYRPVRELPAWQALGPNGEAVAALIERAWSLTADEIQRLGVLDAAWGAARDAAGSAARSAARGAAGSAAWGAAWDAATGAARDAARDAAVGLVVRDLITPEQFGVLYGRWASVIEG